MREDNAAFGKEIYERLVSTLWEKKITTRILAVIRRRRRRNKVLLAAASIILAAGNVLFWFGASEETMIDIAALIDGNDTSVLTSEYLGLPPLSAFDGDVSLNSIDTIMNE